MRSTIFTVFLLLCIGLNSFAQVGINTTSPDPSAALDINTTNSGLLIPRMTESQRDAISSPAEGLMIYQTDGNKGTYQFDGTSWTALGGSDEDWTLSGNQMYNANAGNIGIGNTTPNAVLDVGVSPDTRDAFAVRTNVSTTTTPVTVQIVQDVYNSTIRSSTNFIQSEKTQTFIATATGTITQVTARFFVDGGSMFDDAQDIRLQIRNSSGVIIAVETIIDADLRSNMWEPLTFNISVPVIVDDSYSLSFRNMETTPLFDEDVYWAITNTNVYTDGTFQNNVNLDAEFSITIQPNDVTTTSPDKIVVVNDQGQMSVGHDNPTANLDIEGTLKFVDGSEAANRVLTSDANGNATWQDIATVTNIGEFERSNGVVSNRTSISTDDFVFGSNQLADDTGTTDDDNRMFFDKSKGAFRAGGGAGTNWNDFNVGEYSVGMGQISLASGDHSFAFNGEASASFAISLGGTSQGIDAISLGRDNYATADRSTSIGFNSAATAIQSFAAGGHTARALGGSSTALGSGSTAQGVASTAIGFGSRAESFKEISIGAVESYVPNSTTVWNGNDRIFSIGNGGDGSTIAITNSLTILKNGNTGIGTVNPDFPITIQANTLTGLQSFKDNSGTTQWHLRTQGTSNGDLGFTETGVADNRLVLAEGGNVGIGSADPDFPLTILANTSSGLQSFKDNSGTTQWHLRTQGTGNGDLGFTETGVADNRLVLAEGGNIGIGTATPTRAKLEIAGSGAAITVGTHGFLDASGTTGTSTFSPKEYSIWADGKIAGTEFNAFSDARIKNIKGLSNNEADLRTLSQIEITNYTYKDTIAKGMRPQKKVIAQQVKTVYPQAVTADVTETIPNIYQLSHIKNGWIALTDTSIVTLGDQVQLLFPDTTTWVTVVALSEGKIKVDTQREGSVFVYGTQVHDFHTVDYEALSMLNISATQALLQRLVRLEEETASQNSRLERMEAMLDTLVRQ